MSPSNHNAIPSTVLEAYRLVEPDIPSIQDRIMFLVERSPDGLTSLDLEPIFRVSAVRRLSELREQGRVEFRCANCGASEWACQCDDFRMVARGGLSGAHRGVYFAGGRPIEKMPCPTCGTKVPATKVGERQLTFA